MGGGVGSTKGDSRVANKGGRRGKKAAPPPSPPSSSDAESDGDDSERSYEEEARRWQRLGGREAELDDERAAGILETAKGMHVDDLSSDDEEAGNATGRVPLHWYEGYDHVGYDLGGGKVVADAEATPRRRSRPRAAAPSRSTTSSTGATSS
ncbi:hypothetical protein JL720_1202 [Aureococcus anophagefferens]|nr:hypothetical protein JL720_1202 [Aureococcus anophagefferens]